MASSDKPFDKHVPYLAYAPTVWALRASPGLFNQTLNGPTTWPLGPLIIAS